MFVVTLKKAGLKKVGVGVLCCALVVFNTDTTFTKWTLDDAMSNIAKAIEIDPQPAYKHRETQIVFSKGNYTTDEREENSQKDKADTIFI